MLCNAALMLHCTIIRAIWEARLGPVLDEADHSFLVRMEKSDEQEAEYPQDEVGDPSCNRRLRIDRQGARRPTEQARNSAIRARIRQADHSHREGARRGHA